MLKVDQTVGEIAVQCPASISIFEKLGIDYCCGADQSLAESCRRRGTSPAAVVEEHYALARRGGSTNGAIRRVRVTCGGTPPETGCARRRPRRFVQLEFPVINISE